MKLSPREKVLLIILVLLITFYLFYTFLYHPLEQATASLRAENLNLRSAIKKQQDQWEKGKNEELEINKLELEYQQMMIKLPEEDYLPEIVSYLQKNARSADVLLEKINYHNRAMESSQGNRNDIRTCEMVLVARGSYYNLLTLLRKIEEAPRLFVINNVEISAPEVSITINEDTEIPSTPQEETKPSNISADNNLVMTVQLTTYYDPSSMPSFIGVLEKVPPV